MTQAELVDAARVREAFRRVEGWLAANRDGINAINVYPVPDGDTGTNMLLTWRAAASAAPEEIDHVGQLLGACSRAALLGARGNSGVILSQMLRGLAEATADAAGLDTADVVAGLRGASATAYAAVSAPVEGTMLTVLRDAAQAAEAALAAGGDLAAIFDAAVAEAFASVERTPTLLPRLREAGVVDSGGLGVAVILEGFARGLDGQPLPEALRVAADATVDLGQLGHEEYGYCTEFVVTGEAIDRHAIEAALAGLGGESILVVGDASAVHVHVHLEDPGLALSAGVRHGALIGVKVDNMQAQHEDWARSHRGPASLDAAALPALGLVAVVPGEGFARIFEDLGATCVRTGDGRTSAGALLEAGRRAGRDHAFLLPNDSDTLMAAEQAAREAAGFITVLPARSAPAGIAAAIAYWPEGDPAEVAVRMQEALATVRTVEVTRAARDAVVDGVAVAAGDAIALVDGRLVTRAETLEAALLEGLALAAGEAAEIVTVYRGAEASEEATERVVALVEAAHPGLAVEVMAGGQPHYPYLLGVE